MAGQGKRDTREGRGVDGVPVVSKEHACGKEGVRSSILHAQSGAACPLSTHRCDAGNCIYRSGVEGEDKGSSHQSTAMRQSKVTPAAGAVRRFGAPGRPIVSDWEEEGPAKGRSKELPEKWEENQQQMMLQNSEGAAPRKRDRQRC